MTVSESHNGWDRSAAAWLAQQGEAGDWGRTAVLDPVMRRLSGEAGGRFIDIGCGDGRFVRMLAADGLQGVGIDPTERLIDAAIERDPAEITAWQLARRCLLPMGIRFRGILSLAVRHSRSGCSGA